MDGVLSVYLGAVTIGLIHGLEPGHGWPVAAVYAARRDRPYFFGVMGGNPKRYSRRVSSHHAVSGGYRYGRGDGADHLLLERVEVMEGAPGRVAQP